MAEWKREQEDKFVVFSRLGRFPVLVPLELEAYIQRQAVREWMLEGYEVWRSDLNNSLANLMDWVKAAGQKEP